jgi:hypothetical protein
LYRQKDEHFCKFHPSINAKMQKSALSAMDFIEQAIRLPSRPHQFPFAKISPFGRM